MLLVILIPPALPDFRPFYLYIFLFVVHYTGR